MLVAVLASRASSSRRRGRRAPRTRRRRLAGGGAWSSAAGLTSPTWCTSSAQTSDDLSRRSPQTSGYASIYYTLIGAGHVHVLARAPARRVDAVTALDGLTPYRLVGLQRDRRLLARRQRRRRDRAARRCRRRGTTAARLQLPQWFALLGGAVRLGRAVRPRLRGYVRAACSPEGSSDVGRGERRCHSSRSPRCRGNRRARRSWPRWRCCREPGAQLDDGVPPGRRRSLLRAGRARRECRPRRDPAQRDRRRQPTGLLAG